MVLRIVFTALLLFIIVEHAHGAGTIRGAVVDGVSNQPVPGAHLMAMRVRGELNAQTAIPYRAVADDKGGFTLNNVADGNYQICVEALAGYLDPCSWGTPVGVRVAVSAPEIRIVLQRGVPLNVDFADDRNLLDRFATRLVEGLPSAEIIGPDGKRRMLPRVSQSAWRLSELVPPDVPFTLTVSTRLVSLADERGISINAASGYQTLVRVPQPMPSSVRSMFSRGRNTTEFRVVFRVLDLTEQGRQAAAGN